MCHVTCGGVSEVQGQQQAAVPPVAGRRLRGTGKRGVQGGRPNRIVWATSDGTKLE